jgi:hypothetical protein
LKRANDIVFGKWFSVLTSCAVSITSLGILFSVPNGIKDIILMRNWSNNIEVIRISSNDFTVLYNGNPKSVLLSHIKHSTKGLDYSGIEEKNIIIPPFSYFVVENYKEDSYWEKLITEKSYKPEVFKSSRFEKRNSKFKIVYFDTNHIALNFLNQFEPKPKYFESSIQLYFIANGELKEKIIKGQSIIVDVRNL